MNFGSEAHQSRRARLLQAEAFLPPIVVGYATRYLRPHRIDGGIDIFVPGCFTASLLRKDRYIRFLIEHDSARCVACTHDGLELFDGDVGLRFRLQIPATRLGRSAAEGVTTGSRFHMSIGFALERSHRERIDGIDVRRIEQAELLEISVCRLGAVAGACATTIARDESSYALAS